MLPHRTTPAKVIFENPEYPQIPLAPPAATDAGVNTPSKPSPETGQPSDYITPKELAKRWGCSRSSVDRYARMAGFTRLCLGDGKNAAVRYLREEVIAYEQQRLISMN